MSRFPAVALNTPIDASPVQTGTAGLVLLSVGHFFIDLYAGALGALQPYLVDKLGMSLAQAGWLGGILLLSSSVSQPVWGYLSDRFRSRLFTVLAPAVAGVFLSALPSAPTYLWALLLVALGGAGVASFHPQASARVTHGVAVSRATWMAFFISAGTLGMAFGPTYFSLTPLFIGFPNTWLACLPGIACSAFLWFFLEPAPDAGRRGARLDLAALHAVWRPLAVLYFCVFIRSIVQVTFAQLLPLYLNRERGFSIPHANYTLSVYLAFGAIGGLLGGRLADRIGGRGVIMVSMIGCVPFLLLFFLARGWPSIAGLMIGGLILLFTIPVNVIMAQELAPGQTGTVSALMMGFAWGLPALIFVPLTGWASDLYSMHSVLTALVLTPLAGFFLARVLPDTRGAHRA
ncbi:MAG: MFS transporter [Bryobacteraceae bacterium]